MQELKIAVPFIATINEGSVVENSGEVSSTGPTMEILTSIRTALSMKHCILNAPGELAAGVGKPRPAIQRRQTMKKFSGTIAMMGSILLCSSILFAQSPSAEDTRKIERKTISDDEVRNMKTGFPRRP